MSHIGVSARQVFSAASPALLAPEVVQTSGMDCGPAALASLLRGFGIDASYGRLREVCQTDVDGTSIDTLEEVAVALGLDAEQIVVPADHVLLPEARAMPALAVVTLPDGATHFMVLWRRWGGLVQCMDPAHGRRWISPAQVLRELYTHRMPVPAAEWREWAGTDEFLGPLRRRLRDLGVRDAAPLLDAALADRGWRGLATLDAATRLAAALVRAGGLRPGPEAARALRFSIDASAQDAALIPPAHWSVLPAEPGEGGEEQVTLQCAVVVRARGRVAPDEAGAGEPGADTALAAGLREDAPAPERALLRQLLADGALAPSVLLGALLLGAAAVVFEALLFRGLIDLAGRLAPGWQSLSALGALLLFVGVLLALELLAMSGVLRLSRVAEIRLRAAFARKIPLLGDRYIRSRPIADMAERSHTLHRIRPLVDSGRQLVLTLFELLLTVAALAWLYPASAPAAALVVALLLAVLAICRPGLDERALRVRTHLGGLTRFYLDALLGLVSIRAHGAERTVRRAHEVLVSGWGRAALDLQRGAIWCEGLLAAVGFAGAAWLVLDHVGRAGDAGGVLLLAYWALKIPTLAQQIATFAQSYPADRAVLLRLAEPLAAPEEPGAGESPAAPAPASGGVSLRLDGVTVLAAGHTILEGITLAVEPGEHVAIVGPSGAGKSSLVGLLLGWHAPAAGSACVDGSPLDAAGLERLREATAWVDPAVQLWNRPLLDNLGYGAPDRGATPAGVLLHDADLREVLERLPEGLQTVIGEGGGLLSGGEGQRVRLGRAMARAGARLVILDEPFRGLDRARRGELLRRARRLWQDATLLCITHDIGETQQFARVVVVEGGRVVEDGAPADLLADDGGRYRALLDAEARVRAERWAGAGWRRLSMARGTLREE